MRGGSKKGERRGGRKKGTPNKVTAEVKAILRNAFEDIGGQRIFDEWATNNLTEFYKLWAKMLPTEIKADVNAEVKFKPNAIRVIIPHNNRTPHPDAS